MSLTNRRIRKAIALVVALLFAATPAMGATNFTTYVITTAADGAYSVHAVDLDGDLDVDVVLESTGVFRTRDKIEKHLEAGAKKVLLSVPSKSPEDVVCHQHVDVTPGAIVRAFFRPVRAPQSVKPYRTLTGPDAILPALRADA